MEHKAILLERVLKFHERVLEVSGGASGVRDNGVLDAAISRPFATFGGEDLYPDIYAKAAALIESLVMNHPFVDGNKRTGFFSGISLLINNGVRLEFTEDEGYDFAVAIASGQLEFDAIDTWLRSHTSNN